MGIISNMANKSSSWKRSGGVSKWREIFGDNSTDKEDGFITPPSKPRQGGNIASSDNAVKRLIEALRSRAPGSWTDDRWEQTMRHFVGIGYVAIHRLGMQLSRAEFQVYRKDPTHPDGKRPVTPEDPEQGGRDCRPYDLVKLLEKPNKKDSFGKLMYRWNQQKMLTGTAYTYMVPNMLGIPMELYPIPTALATPMPANNPDYPDGYYKIMAPYPYGPFSAFGTPNSSTGAPISTKWMMSFQFPHPLLRYEGYSPQTGLRLHIDGVDSIDRSRFYTMKRTFRPNMVLQMENMEGAQPLIESEMERVIAEIEAAFQGPENNGKVFVAPPGGRIEQFGTNPIDMDYQSGWEQLVSFIMGGFGITKPAAGMVEDSSYSTLFATLKQLYLITLDPECDDLASELTRTLAPFYGDDLIIEIRCRRIDDHEIKEKNLRLLMDGKAITKNELRKECEFPVTHEEWGNEIAGFEAPPEPPPGMAPPGMDLNQMQQGGGINDLLEQDGENPMDEQINDRPDTGSLGEGALGPRKSIIQTMKKVPKMRKTVNGISKKLTWRR